MAARMEAALWIPQIPEGQSAPRPVKKVCGFVLPVLPNRPHQRRPRMGRLFFSNAPLRLEGR